MSKIKEWLLVAIGLAFWPAFIVGGLWLSSLGTKDQTPTTDSAVEVYNGQLEADLQREELSADPPITPEPEADPQTTCVDVTSYDYDWSNDMLCTRPDGSKFYTDYAGANAAENN